jgi:ribonuclease-3
LSPARTNNVVSTRASNAYLAEQGFLRGLDNYVYNNPSQGNFVSDGLMATTMEAILGAVFLESDGNISVFQNVMVFLGLSWPE